jgi:hypothetical protein
MMGDENKASARDELAIWINAAAQLNPATGFLAALINGYVSSARQVSMKQMIEILFQRVNELEDRIDTKVLREDEFADLFNSCLLMAARTTRKNKLRLAAEILSNSLLKPGDRGKLGSQELDLFARCVDGLSIGAIGALGAMSRDRTRGEARLRPGGSVVFNFGDVQRLIEHTDAELLMGLIGELNRFNLVHLPGAPTVPSADYANYPVHLTPLGIRFAELLMNAGNTA